MSICNRCFNALSNSTEKTIQGPICYKCVEKEEEHRNADLFMSVFYSIIFLVAFIIATWAVLA